MTKRLLAMVLVCILAIPIMAVPASASQVTGTQFDQFTLGLGNLLNDIEENILAYIDSVIGNTYIINENLRLWFEGQGGWLYKIYLKMVSAVDYLETIDEYVFDTLTETISIRVSIEYLQRNLQGWFTTQTTALQTTFTNIVTALQSRLDNWLGQIVGYLDEIRFGNRNNQSYVDDLGEEIEQQETQFQDDMEVIQDVTRPEYEDLDLSIGGLEWNYNFGFDDTYWACLGYLIESSFIMDLLFVAFTLSAVSFVIFGKR